MNWTDIIIALIAAAGGFAGSVISNNKQVAVLAAKLERRSLQSKPLG